MDVRKFFKSKRSPDATKSQPKASTSSPSDAQLGSQAGSSSSKIAREPQPEASTSSPSDVQSGSQTGSSKIATEADARAGASLGTIGTGPSQPRLKTYPTTVQHGQKRSFSPKYFSEFSWVEYSIKDDKVFCFVCRHFGSQSVRDQNEVFVTKGFQNWKKIKDKLTKHDKSESHIQCVQQYKRHQLETSGRVGSVLEQVSAQSEIELAQKIEYVKKLFKLASVLSRQGLAFRGHDESQTSSNKGNFLEIADLLGEGDENFKKYLRQKMYTSPQIQNEMISAISEETLSVIVSGIKSAGMMAIVLDEARCYKEEQMSVVVRYPQNLNVQEHFLAFLNCSSSQDAESLVGLIGEFFKKLGIDEIPIRAQSYDGASVMSGKHRGVQALVKRRHPSAIYVHCMAHKINLVVTNSCLNIPAAVNFFNTVEALYHHYNKPCNHHRLEEVQRQLGIKKKSLNSLSTTRWACRHKNCENISENFRAIITALEDEIHDNQNKDAIEAQGILSNLLSSTFVVLLCIMKDLLLKLNTLSQYFQRKESTLGGASILITGVLATMKEERCHFKIWEDIKKFGEQHEVSLDHGRSSKRKKSESVSLKDFIVDTTVGQSDSSSSEPNEQYWKRIYYQVLDTVITNFEERFGDNELPMAISNFLKFDLECAEAFINNYVKEFKIDPLALKAEATVIKNYVKTKNIPLEEQQQQVTEDITPNLFRLLQIAKTVPCSSASAERSFSAMRRIKTWLRSAMEQCRFSSLAIIHIENDFVKRVDLDNIVKRFVSSKDRVLLK